jgi:uncharacterized membrane protein
VTTKTAALESSPPLTRDWLRIVSLLLVAAGLFVSGYLSYTKLTQTALVCVEGGTFNCDIVSNSIYSRIFGIEVAYLGFLTYLALGALLLLERRVTFLRDYGTALMFGLTLFAFLFSMWLVYVQVALLQALCPWCLAHELIMTFLFIIASARLWRTFQRA